MGTRLGMGVPKSLIELNGRPLIHWQLAMLDDVKDVRIVVGYQAEAMIAVARSVRPDVLFVFNQEYRTTNTAHSLYLGARHVRGDVLSLDGDLLVARREIHALLAAPAPVIGITAARTEQPVLVTLGEAQAAIRFSRDNGDAEWTGLVKLPAERIVPGSSYVFEMLEAYLPLPTHWTECCEIDTPGDYDAAANWVRDHLSKL